MAFGRRSELGGGDCNRDGAEGGEKAASHGCSPLRGAKAGCNDRSFGAASQIEMRRADYHGHGHHEAASKFPGH
jgi:hypothetical protein